MRADDGYDEKLDLMLASVEPTARARPGRAARARDWLRGRLRRAWCALRAALARR